MPPIGSMSGPEEQIMIGCASFAESQAISAKVGEAARPSQPAALARLLRIRAHVVLLR